MSEYAQKVQIRGVKSFVQPDEAVTAEHYANLFASAYVRKQTAFHWLLEYKSLSNALTAVGKPVTAKNPKMGAYKPLSG